MVRVDGQHPGRCQRQSQAGERSTTRGMANNPNDDMLDWGTRSIPRHNPLRGWGALPTHTRGNAADGVTPGFMAESPWDSRTGMGAESAYHDRKSFVVNDVNPFNHKDLRSELLRPPRKNDPPKCHPHRRECIAQRRRGAESPIPFSQRLSVSARDVFRGPTEANASRGGKDHMHRTELIAHRRRDAKHPNPVSSSRLGVFA